MAPMPEAAVTASSPPSSFASFSSNTRSVGQLESGEMDALIVQNPFAMGYLGVASACDAVAGRAVDQNVDTATTVVTSANMFAPDIQKILYRFE